IDIAIGVANRHVFDKCAGISPSKNEAHFTNSSMKNLACSLDQLIGPNRHLGDVAVFEKTVSVLSFRRIIEESVSINAIGPLFEDCVTKNVLGIVMPMLPNERHPLLILMTESSGHNRSTVSALEPRLSRVSAKITFHFDCSFQRLVP